eukprot:TRINITY_DN92394_c0_g1_i1.p1 TRINITY_DN92394_c0_g1~~TRINITY_DN92394_c0_g1_i1.p1  ORF type:complete len:439 (-),score=102.58 TRINITY_DN92394_c0_g1_i1:473-1789(-)
MKKRKGEKQDASGAASEGAVMREARSTGSQGLPPAPPIWLSLMAIIGSLSFALYKFVYKRERSFAELQEYVAEAGGKVDCVDLGEFDYPGVGAVRGLRATCDAEAGDLLLSVPEKAILSDVTLDARVLRLVATALEKDPHEGGMARDVALAAGLLAEASQKSFELYFKTLPEQAPSNLPLWDETQLNALSAVQWNVVTFKNLFISSLRDVVESKATLFSKNVGEEELAWAMSMVISRQVHGRMIPIFDHANHAKDPVAEHDCDKKGCHLIARRKVSKGEEVTISYGAKSNLNMLFAYGFAVEGNTLSSWNANMSSLQDSGCAVSKMALDGASAHGLAATDGLKCLEDSVEAAVLLGAIKEACKKLKEDMVLPKVGPKRMMGLALGRTDADEAVAELEEKTPRSFIDDAILAAIKQELELPGRCVEKASSRLGGLEKKR